MLSRDVVDGFSYRISEEDSSQATPERGWAGSMSDYVWGYVDAVARELYKSHPDRMVSGLAEEYAFGRMLGNNWAFRPAGEGDRFFLEDDPAMTSAFREAAAFFRRLDAELLSGARQTWAEVAVLHDPLSASLCGDAEVRLNLALYKFFFKRGIPFHIVLPDQPVPESVRYLVVFHVGAISDRTLATVKEFATQEGHQVWLAGNTAQNDEWFVPRDKRELAALRSSPGVYFTPEFGETWQRAFLHPIAASASQAAGYVAAQSLELDGADAAVFDAFVGSPDYRPIVQFERPEYVLVHSQRTESGRIVFHSRDQSGSGEVLSGINILLGGGFPAVSGWRIFRPGHAAEALTFSSNSGDRVANLPPFQHYALVVTDA